MRSPFIKEIINDAFPRALRDAALEAFGGAYLEEDLQNTIDLANIKERAMNLLREEQYSERQANIAISNLYFDKV